MIAGTAMKLSSPLIGILGGMGPQAGLDMAQKLVLETRTGKDQDHLPFILFSMPASVPDRTEFLLGISEENPAYAIADQFEAMAETGVKLAAMACNTAHAAPIFDVVLDLLDERGVDLRIFHLVKETIQRARVDHPDIQRIGVLATKGTYQSRLYDLALEEAGLEAINPDSAIRDELIHAALYAPSIGIKATGGTVTPGAIQRIQRAINHLREKGAEAIILGCTEIPLAVNQASVDGTPILDPALIMARKLIRESCPGRLCKPG